MDIQRLSKEVGTQFEVAQKYYQVLSVLNGLQLAEGEIQLIAYTAIKGNITDFDFRKEFCDTYKTTIATINNMVYRLKKKNIFHKKGKLIFVNPALTKLSFDKSMVLVINIKLPENGA